MELGPEDVSLLERCPHFKGCYVHVQASMEFLYLCTYYSLQFADHVRVAVTVSRQSFIIMPHPCTLCHSEHV